MLINRGHPHCTCTCNCNVGSLHYGRAAPCWRSRARAIGSLFGTCARAPLLHHGLLSSSSSSCAFPSSSTVSTGKMAERQQGGGPQQQLPEPPLQSPQSQTPAPTTSEEMIGCVAALEAALLPCLPARELQAIDRSPHPSHQIDVEKHARDFMEAAKKLQLYLTALQREDQPSSSSAEMLRKDIATMEEELKVKTAIIKNQEQLIEGWRRQLQDQLDRHKDELSKV